MGSFRQLARMCRDLAKQHIDESDVPAERCERVRQVGADRVNSVSRRAREESPRDGRLPQRDARCPRRVWTR